MKNRFHGLQEDMATAIKERTICFGNSVVHRKYAKRYADGDFKPGFALFLEEGVITCEWCQNRPRGCPEIIRLSTLQATEGLTPEEWESFSLQVKHAMKAEGLY